MTAQCTHAEDLATFRAFLRHCVEHKLRVDYSTAPQVAAYTRELEALVWAQTQGLSRREVALQRALMWQQQAQILFDAVFGEAE